MVNVRGALVNFLEKPPEMPAPQIRNFERNGIRSADFMGGDGMRVLPETFPAAMREYLRKSRQFRNRYRTSIESAVKNCAGASPLPALRHPVNARRIAPRA
jgi:hypothetical protein